MREGSKLSISAMPDSWKLPQPRKSNSGRAGTDSLRKRDAHQELISPHQQEGDKRAFAIGLGTEDLPVTAWQLSVLLELFGHEVVFFAGMNMLGVSWSVVQVLHHLKRLSSATLGKKPTR